MFDYIANLLVWHLLGLDADTRSGDALHFFVADTIKIFVLLVVIIYVMGLLRALLSPDSVREYVRGKPKWLARMLAILLGAVTPFCACSSVPLFIGFVEAGIPLGVTFSFLIASPMINEVAAVLLVGILGWKIASLYVAAGFVVAYLGGVIMERFRLERWVEDYVWKIHVGEAQLLKPDRSLAGRHRYAWFEVKEIIGRIAKWVIIGVAVGSLFHGYVPEDWVVTHLAGRGNWVAVPVAVLLGVPLYSNAIPIAEAMVAKGVAMGTTLSFMMSIASLSLPEMLILRKVIRWPALAIYAAVLVVAFTLVGWGFNSLL